MAEIGGNTDGVFAHPTRATLKRFCAKVAELADAPDLGSGGRKVMGVRVPPFALFDLASVLTEASLRACQQRTKGEAVQHLCRTDETLQ